MAMRLEYLTNCAKMPHKWGFNVPHHKQHSPDLHSSYGIRKRKLQNPITTASTNPSKNRTFEGFY